MKKLLIATLLFTFVFSNISAQNGVNNGQAKMLNQHLQLVNPSLFEKKSDGTFDLNFKNFKGSPFEKNEFVSGTIVDASNKTQTKMYLRYNMYSDEIEIKSNIYMPKANALLKLADLGCIINNVKYNYLGFTNDEGTQKYGYLKLIYKGVNYSLYQRLKSRYIPKEDDHDTSYRRPQPARFEKNITYYLKHDGKITSIPSSKRILFRNYSSISHVLKPYVKKLRPRLKDQNDLLRLVKYLDNKG